MRVLMCSPDLELHGGVSASVRALLPHLPEVDVLTVGRRARRSLQPLLDPLRIVRGRRGHRVLHLNPSLRPRALVRDLTLLSLWRGEAAAFWIHGWDVDFTEAMPRVLRTRLVAASRRATPVTLTEGFADRLVDLGVERHRIRVIPPPFVPMEERTEREGPDIVYLGRMVGGKGLVPLLHGFAKVVPRLGDAKLRLLGEGSLRRELIRTVDELGLNGRVLLPGHVTGAAKIDALHRSSVIVLASRSEGLPVCLLEGMSQGLAVIATPVGGVPTLVDPRGGVLLQQSTSDHIAAALVNILLIPGRAAAMGAHNREVVANYTAAKVAARWRAVYREVAG